jgi:serine protease inhibitor
MKTQRLFIALSFSSLILISNSCKKSNEPDLPKDPVQIPLTAEQTALVSSQNNFALDLFRNVLASSGEAGNIIISPFSVSTALSMTMNGAAGPTRDSMLYALRMSGMTPENVNNSYKDLSYALLNTDPRVKLSIANSVWPEKDFSVKESFTDILRSSYDAEVKSFDGADPLAYVAVNNWIEDKTNGLIKKMLLGLDDNTVMLLINAIYFKGKWKHQFDADHTAPRAFYKSGGSTVQVPMMKQYDAFSLYQGEGFTLAEFPYGQGNFAMDVLLPQSPETISGLASALTPDKLSTWLGQMHAQKITLYMPRFKFGYKLEMNDVLSDMGMGLAFNDNADFSNIADASLKISQVLHQAFIQNDEEGTTAAAATVVVIGITSTIPTELKLDHPFIYIIRETSTNAILFMGIVADPGSN